MSGQYCYACAQQTGGCWKHQVRTILTGNTTPVTPSGGDGFKWWYDEACKEIASLRAALEEKTRRVETLEKAARRVVECEGGYLTGVEFTREMSAAVTELDIALHAALTPETDSHSGQSTGTGNTSKPEPSHVSKCGEENHNPMTHWPVGCDGPPLEGDGT